MDSSSNSVATGITLTVGTINIAGTLLGMHYDSLLFGLLGGLIMLSSSERGSRSHALSNVLAGILVAGVGSPILVEVVISVIGILGKLGSDNLRPAAAMLIGGSWHVGLPVIFKAFKKLLLRE